ERLVELIDAPPAAAGPAEPVEMLRQVGTVLHRMLGGGLGGLPAPLLRVGHLAQGPHGVLAKPPVTGPKRGRELDAPRPFAPGHHVTGTDGRDPARSPQHEQAAPLLAGEAL